MKAKPVPNIFELRQRQANRLPRLRRVSFDGQVFPRVESTEPYAYWNFQLLNRARAEDKPLQDPAFGPPKFYIENTVQHFDPAHFDIGDFFPSPCINPNDLHVIDPVENEIVMRELTKNFYKPDKPPRTKTSGEKIDETIAEVILRSLQEVNAREENNQNVPGTSGTQGVKVKEFVPKIKETENSNPFPKTTFTINHGLPLIRSAPPSPARPSGQGTSASAKIRGEASTSKSGRGGKGSHGKTNPK